jgi:hypothetical protein
MASAGIPSMKNKITGCGGSNDEDENDSEHEDDMKTYELKPKDTT